MIRVSINILGRFHFFDAAKHFEKRDVLSQLITSYPASKANEWVQNPKYIYSLVFFELIRRLLFLTKLYNPTADVYVKLLYGIMSRRKIDSSANFYIFFAGNSFNSNAIINLKKRGVVCIADEGSADIRSNIKILEDEYRRLGLPWSKKIRSASVNETVREYEYASAIVVPSTFVKKTLIDNGINSNKIHINPYGVDLSNFFPGEKKDDIFRIIYCGNLCIQKGSHILLKCFHELDLPNSELWHIGGVSSEIDQWLMRYGSKKVHLLGAKDQKALRDFYIQGSVFCLPSVQDGFGMVVLQAMACGLPAICSTNTCATDVITHGQDGYVFESGNEISLKEYILAMYESPERLSNMSAAAIDKVKSGFSWDDYADRYLSIINRLRLSSFKNE